MSTNFPSSLDNSTTLPAESANIPLSTNHVTAHQNIQDAIEAIEAKVGVDSSAVTTSLDYLVKNTSSSNPGHKHTLANGATDVTASASELNILDGATLSTTELNYVDGVTSAIQTQLDAKALDSAVVHDTGNETIAGIKTFSSDPLIPDEAYGSGWNGVLEPPTKNAVYDKIETLANFDKIPNTDEISINYRTLYMPILVAGPDASSQYMFVGWSDANISASSGDLPSMGGVYTFPGNADSVIYTTLAPISKSQNSFRFADLGANEVRLKFDLVPSVVAASERYAWGLSASGATSIYLTRTSTADNLIRFVLEENGGVDKLWAVNSNGTNYNATDITGSLTLTEEHIFELVITSTSIKYYVDGTLAATHTTYIPTSTNSTVLAYGMEHNGTGGSRNIYPAIVSLPTGI